jgi:hypothetical protein
MLAGVLAAGKTSHMKFGLTTYQWGMDWDIPTLLANCVKAKAFGVELRTSEKYAHGVELDLTAARRAEAKGQFSASPVKLIGMACGERFDSPDPARLKASIETVKEYVKLTHDVGASGLRVFPNDFHKEVPQEKTLEQIAASLKQVGEFAAGMGLEIRLENHGTAGRLPNLKRIMDMVGLRNVRITLNSDVRDAEGGIFENGFRMVENHLAATLHMHDLKDEKFPYQLQCDLLIDRGWSGWWLAEMSTKVPDRLQALISLREQWEGLVARSLKR